MITSLNIIVSWIDKLIFDIKKRKSELNALKWVDLMKKNDDAMLLFAWNMIDVTIYVDDWDNIASSRAFTIIKFVKITYFANRFVRFIQLDAETATKWQLLILII